MDFISALLSTLDMDMQKVIQLVYILILIWMLTRYVPKRDKEYAKERADREEAFKEERQERDQAFLETINSYRDALINFQEKEDAAHAKLIEMISTHDQKAREGHKQTLRILRAIADRLDTKLYED